VGGGVGTNVGILAIGKESAAALSNEGEGIGEASSADGADEASDSGEGELHCEFVMNFLNEDRRVIMQRT
jgi:hypothetical protein